MGVGQFSVAAATAVVGYDLCQGQIWQTSAMNRAIKGFGLKGSTAALDTKVSLFVDTKKIGEFYNTGTGMPNNDDIMALDMNLVPAGAMIHCYVDDAPASNPINGTILLQDL